MNARDQVIRLQQMKSKDPVTTLKITIDKETGLITIYNDGEGIDIAEHPTEKDKDGKLFLDISGKLDTTLFFNHGPQLL